jgi:membrane-associated phospholipid phosphatase
VNTLAKIVSYLFHPLLMATYVITLFSFVFPAAIFPVKTESRVAFLVPLFLLTFVLPAVNIMFFRIFGMISSFAMKDHSDRIKPFFLIVLLYGLFTVLLHFKTGLKIGDNLFNLILVIDALVLCSFLVTLAFKASIHSLSIWGAIGILLPLNKVADGGSLFVPTLIALVLAGLVMSARLQLNAHTPREVLIGSVVGFSVSFFAMIVLF